MQLIYFPTAVVLVLLFAFADRACAESGTRQQTSQQRTTAGGIQRMQAKPKLAGSNPYRPSSQFNVKLPLAASGYSMVSLRDQQKWVGGQEAFQAIFDGQLYWFANQREKDIFVAAPEKYAPILGGDCIVTYAETAKRVPGDPRYGVVHRGRIYFLANEQMRERFQSDADQFSKADVSHDGNCVVCKIDQQKVIQGFPEIVATYGGLRYFFAGSHQRAMFGASPARYGARQKQRDQGSTIAPIIDKPTPQLLTPESPSEDSAGQQAIAMAKPLAEASEKEQDASKPKRAEIPDGKLVMEGYCPVSIREQGIWIRGNLDFAVERGDKVYLLAGELQKEKFLTHPKRYTPVLNGDCIVSLLANSKRTSGSVFYSKRSKDNTQLFLFAGAEEKRLFEANPTIYLEAASKEVTPVQ